MHYNYMYEMQELSNILLAIHENNEIILHIFMSILLIPLEWVTRVRFYCIRF